MHGKHECRAEEKNNLRDDTTHTKTNPKNEDRPGSPAPQLAAPK